MVRKTAPVTSDASGIGLANAGVSTTHCAVKVTGEEWQQNFAMNVRGVLLPKQVAGRFMPSKALNGTRCEYGA